MVRDGIYYALGLLAVALVLAWLAGPWYVVPPLLLAAFFLWFFRDPERRVPQQPGLIVAPADGKVTDVSTLTVDGKARHRISIFLNVFDVHVNRSPIAGVVREVEYRKGLFKNAMGNLSAEHNEQNIVTVEGEGQSLVFKQIAGLLARRIVFTPKVGDTVARGQRIGMMKFSSRMDVVMDGSVAVAVRIGDHTVGGVTVIGRAQPVAQVPATNRTAEQTIGGGR
jgi:phosphatidylserine decarboxylase